MALNADACRAMGRRPGMIAKVGETRIPKRQRAAVFAERLLGYHRRGSGGSPAHRLAGRLLAEYGSSPNARFALAVACVDDDARRRADSHLETAGVRVHPLALRLYAEHRELARVVLRRLRFCESVTPEDGAQADNDLAAFGLPLRVQPGLPLQERLLP